MPNSKCFEILGEGISNCDGLTIFKLNLDQNSCFYDK